MQIRMTVARSRECQHETHQRLAIKCADDLPANLGADYKQPERHQFRVAEVPHLFLQGDAGAHLVETMTVTNDHCIGLHRLVFSNCFDCCHSDSSSSIETWCG